MWIILKQDFIYFLILLENDLSGNPTNQPNWKFQLDRFLLKPSLSSSLKFEEDPVAVVEVIFQ
jgi:hypothetical protein